MAVNAGNISVLTQDVEQNITNYSKRVCVVGIKSTAGASANFGVVKNIRSVSTVNEQFGRNSHIAQSLKTLVEFNANRALEEHNLFIDAVGINQIGTKATGSIVLSGTATEDKDCLITITNEYEKKLLSIRSGQTATQIIAELHAILSADLNLCVVSEIDGVDNTKLNLTATNEGSWANHINIVIENLPSGITQTITQLTGGNYTGLNDLTNLKNAINDIHYHAILIEDDFFTIDPSLRAFFDTRATKAINKVKAGLVYTYKHARTNDITGFINNDLTGQYLVSCAMYNIKTLPSIILANEILGRYYGAMVKGYDTSDYLTVHAGRGTPANANLPLNEFRLNTIYALKENFSEEKLVILKERGFLTIENSDSGTYAQFTGNMSMYQETIGGQKPTLNRINDVVRKQIAMELFFNASKLFKNKVVRTTKVHDFDITKESIKLTYEEILNLLAGKSRVDNIVYGYYQDNEASLQRAMTKISASIDNQVLDGRTVAVETLNEIAKTIENVITTLKFN